MRQELFIFPGPEESGERDNHTAPVQQRIDEESPEAGISVVEDAGGSI